MNKFIEITWWIWELDTRLLEIVFGVILLTRGLTLWSDGKDMGNPTYQAFTDIMPENAWGTLFTFVGLIQIFSVIINGNWRHSPALRFTGTAISAVCFTMLTVGFWHQSNWTVSLAAALYMTMALAVVWCSLNILSKN